MTASMNTMTETATPAPVLAEPQGPIAGAALEMLRLIEDFGSLLLKETDALKKADFRLVELLQDDKRHFAKRYHAVVNLLSSRRDEVAKLDLGLQERLIKARTSFTIILNENLRALEAAKDSTRRLVDRILDTARKAVTDELQTNYSARGRTQAYKTASLSLNIDRSL